MGVCGAMGLHAFSYNLISGTREAITYDSLLAVGRTEEYERVAGRQSTIWPVSYTHLVKTAGMRWIGLILNKRQRTPR